MRGTTYYIYLALAVYLWMNMASVVLDWFELSPRNPLYSIRRFLGAMTEPYMRPFRRLVPRVGRHGQIDVSPLVGLLVLFFAMQVVLRL